MPRAEGAGESTEDLSREEEESEGDWGRVAMGGWGEGWMWCWRRDESSPCLKKLWARETESVRWGIVRIGGSVFDSFNWDGVVVVFELPTSLFLLGGGVEAESGSVCFRR